MEPYYFAGKWEYFDFTFYLTSLENFNAGSNFVPYIRSIVILFLVPSGTYFHLELSHAVHTRLRKDWNLP